MNTATDARVLIVDDDTSFCEALGRAMQRRGWMVYSALDIASAQRSAEEHRPGYAIIDLRIGETSGLSLVEALRRQLPALRMVVLTGYASVATAVEAIKLGARHYLTKPADPDEIIAAFDQGAGNPSVPPPEQPMSVRRMEWEHIQKVLNAHQGNVSAAARALGMHRRTLQRKLQKRPARS